MGLFCLRDLFRCRAGSPYTDARSNQSEVYLKNFNVRVIPIEESNKGHSLP